VAYIGNGKRCFHYLIPKQRTCLGSSFLEVFQDSELEAVDSFIDLLYSHHPQGQGENQLSWRLSNILSMNILKNPEEITFLGRLFGV